MKEILFRGFHPNEDGEETIYINKEKINGEWVKGYYTKHKYGHFISSGEEVKPCCCLSARNIKKIKSETLSQFTGLTDKNGNKIFENDLIEFGFSKRNQWLGEVDKSGKATKKRIAPVEWDVENCQYILSGDLYVPLGLFINSDLEVVGNKFQKEN